MARGPRSKYSPGGNQKKHVGKLITMPELVSGTGRGGGCGVGFEAFSSNGETQVRVAFEPVLPLGNIAAKGQRFSAINSRAGINRLEPRQQSHIITDR